jgi:hypothetical protein
MSSPPRACSSYHALFNYCAALLLGLLLALPVRAARSTWTTVSYGDLVDRGALVRTGQSLGEVLSGGRLAPSLRGAVQPLLDPYSTLLPEAVEMIAGPSMAPYRDVADLYPEGVRQPAWVAVLRGGRIVVQTDGGRGVRIFVPGEAARAAYQAHYSLLRHVLAGLANSSLGDSRALRIEVYAYRHDYARTEFRLKPEPFRFEASKFPPPAGRRPLDLESIDAFFRSGASIAGAEINPADGLVFVPDPTNVAVLAGGRPTLADFAVAYRAIFHAGDNAAFISLDPHADPALAAVNFGGFLENTRIGATVLEADKRFKTLGCGLDADDQGDRRSLVREKHPSFLTVAERDLARAGASGNRWIGTRFWFYPEAVEIESDPEYRAASIRKARFVADAERQRGDFGSPAEFERFKRQLLSPSIRASIDDLNVNYDRYAAVFPELRELESVARLLGICAWLKKAGSAALDLDALLSVELPPFSTPRARPQMITANWIVLPDSAARAPGVDAVRAHLVSHYLTSELDSPIVDFFPDAGGLAAFLGACEAEASAARGVGSSEERVREAERILASRGREPVRRLVTKKTDLQAFSRIAAERRSPARLYVLELESGIAARRDEIVGLTRRIERISGEIEGRQRWMESTRARLAELESTARTGAAFAEVEYDSLVRVHNRTVDEVTDLVAEGRELSRLHDLAIGSANALVTMGQSIRASHVLSIGGGINLGADDFRIRVRSAPRGPSRRTRAQVAGAARDSAAPQARSPRVVARLAASEGPRPDTVLAAFANPIPRRTWQEIPVAASSPGPRGAGAIRRHVAAAPGPVVAAPSISPTRPPPAPSAPTRVEREGYWFSGDDSASARARPGWRDALITDQGRREREYDPAGGELRLREVTLRGEERVITARRPASGRIVFTRGGSPSVGSVAAAAGREEAVPPEWW